MIKCIHFSLFFLFSLLNVNNLYSQSITPYTLSNGGGSSTTMEWSMGESVSIANFIASGYSLNTGVFTLSYEKIKTAKDCTEKKESLNLNQRETLLKDKSD